MPSSCPSVHPSLLELMTVHVTASYTHDEDGRLVAVNDWVGGVAPRFWLGRTRAGAIWRFRADLPAALCAQLTALCQTEATTDPPEQLPTHAAAYRRLLAEHAPVLRSSAGPTYWLADAPRIHGAAVAISAANSHLLAHGLDEWIPDVPHQQPFLVAVADGQAVAVCTSVRITDQAHAAGVETIPAYRGQGYAGHAVAAWARAVMALGRIPLYSTSWDNGASQRVAAKVGFSLFGAEFHIT